LAAQTWNALQTTFLAISVKAQPPYGVPPADFAALMPQATSYAEERIFTDIPFLGHRAANTSLSTTPGSRVINLAMMANMSGGPIIVPESFNLITVAPTGGRIPFVRATPFLIDQFWPTEATTQTPSVLSFLPRYWAMQDNQTIIYAPTADAAYTVEIAGLYQPTPISQTNQSTYISSTYPAMFEAACMVFLTGALLHNYGSQADNPQQGLSWEGLYQQLMTSARAEELRRRGVMPDVPMPTAAAAAGAPQ
jgi:hypothetical protein